MSSQCDYGSERSNIVLKARMGKQDPEYQVTSRGKILSSSGEAIGKRGIAVRRGLITLLSPRLGRRSNVVVYLRPPTGR